MKMNYWNKQTCKDEALKYKYRYEFQKNSPGAYTRARLQGYLNEICSHMLVKGNNKLRCIYAFEFSDNYVYIGLTCDIEERTQYHLYGKNKFTKDIKYISQVFKHINKTNLKPCFKQLTDFIIDEKAQKMEEYYKNLYIKNCWNILNVAKTGGLGGNKVITWTKEKCIKEALKYKTKQEFRKNSNGAYQAALRGKYIGEICLHMQTIINIKNYWSKDRCQNEAFKYTKRNVFRINSGSAYSAAIKNKWLNEICSHM